MCNFKRRETVCKSLAVTFCFLGFLLSGRAGRSAEAHPGQPLAAEKREVLPNGQPGDDGSASGTETVLLPDKGRLRGKIECHGEVIVDDRIRAESKDGTPGFGWLNSFAAVPGIRFVDVSSSTGICRRNRRAVAYVDGPGSDKYAFEVFQVVGGRKHVLALYGPPTSNFVADPAPAAPYAETKSLFADGKFTNAQQAGAALTGPVKADWRLSTAQVKNMTDATTHLQTITWGAEGGKLLAADVTGDGPLHAKGIFIVRTGERLDSNFISLISGYDTTPFIASVNRLKTEGPDAQWAAALEVIMTSGRRDVLIYNAGKPGDGDSPLAPYPDTKVLVGRKALLKGSFGLVSRDKTGKVRKAFLVAGTTLDAEGFLVKADTAAYESDIQSVDPETGLVRLTTPLQTKFPLKGQYAVVGTGGPAQIYQIDGVAEDGSSLRLKGSLQLLRPQGTRVRINTFVLVSINEQGIKDVETNVDYSISSR